MVIFSVLLALIAVVWLLPGASDLISLLRLSARRANGSQRPSAVRPRFLFVVPAHNEEALIRSCVFSILAQDYPTDRVQICVIADNCTDRTAAVVRSLGVACLERSDHSRRGKPFAIAWALERLSHVTTDAIVVVDADAVLDPGFAKAMALAAPLSDKVVQGYNAVRNPENALTRMSVLLSAANHGVAYRLKGAVGLNVPVGMGFALGARVLRTHGWSAFSLSEDWELYALFSERGVRIECAPEARLYAEEANSLSRSTLQRARWTAGKLKVLLRHGPRLLRSRMISLHQKLDAIAELTSNGPATQLGLVLVLAGLAALLQVPGSPLIQFALLLSLARPTLYAVVAWTRDPHPLRTLAAFGFFPVYVIWRLGVQIRALRLLGDAPWLRAERNP